MIINILDCEWLTWSLKSNYNELYRKKKQKKEIIQIGILKTDIKKNKILSKKNIYIKPYFSKKVPKRIIKLTGISDKILKKKGVEFNIAYKQLIKFIKKHPTITNGGDEKVIKYNCSLNRINSKELKSKKFYNYRNFLKRIIKKKDLSTNNLIKIFNLKGFYSVHNALTDCLIIKNSIIQLKSTKRYFNNFKKFIDV